MTAAMKIYELSALAAGTDKTNATVRFKMADNVTVDNNNPMVIPTSATDNRSYSKQLRFYCATAPDTQIDNLEAYTDGSESWTGVTVEASNVATAFAANATAAITNATDLFNFTSGSAFDMDAQSGGTVTATGFCGDIMKLQMVVASDASSGALTAETLTFSYDEI